MFWDDDLGKRLIRRVWGVGCGVWGVRCGVCGARVLSLTSFNLIHRSIVAIVQLLRHVPQNDNFYFLTLVLGVAEFQARISSYKKSPS